MDDQTLTFTGVIEAVRDTRPDAPQDPRWARLCIGAGCALVVASAAFWAAVNTAARVAGMM